MKSKYNLYFILSAIFVVALISTLALSNRKGTYSIGEPAISIECTSPNANGEVTCDVILSNDNHENIVSVNANYNTNTNLFTSNVINGQIAFDAIDSCSSNNCFQDFVSTNNGFAVVNTLGTTQAAQVGTMTFTVNGTSNAEYTVGLTDVELCKKVNDEYVMIELEDVSTTFRIKNNVATLDNITLAGVQPKTESYSMNNYEYSATVLDNVDTVTLNLTKTDNNATITGITNNLSLHYGTNTFSITVIAEDGVTSQAYTISIYREFDFNPGNDSYVYDSTNNYLYIKTDNLNNFTSNLGTLPSNMSYNVSNNKLEIKYSNEVLHSIDVIYFTSNYQIIGSNIYVTDNITLGTLQNNFTGTGVTFKVYRNNTELTNNASTINNNDVIKVYKGNSELDSYTITIENITFDNSLVIDDNKKIIKRLPIGMTFGDLKNLITTTGTITLETDTTVTDEYNLRTGDNLKITLSNTTVTYTLSVVGCLNADEEVDLGDIILIYRHFKHVKELTEDEYISAADINNNGSVGLDDVILLYRYLKGKINSLEGY